MLAVCVTHIYRPKIRQSIKIWTRGLGGEDGVSVCEKKGGGLLKV